MIKAWFRWVRYVNAKLDDSRTQVSNSTDKLLRFSIIKSNLDNVKRRIDPMLKELKKLQNVNKRELENAQEVLDPEKRNKETGCVKKWFSSDIQKVREGEVNKIWKATMASKKSDPKARIGEKAYGKVANYARFSLALTSKNRNACMNFTNKDYASRTKVWISETSLDLPLEEVLKNYEQITAPPKDQPDLPPNGSMIKLSGGGASIKNQEAQTVFINEYAAEFLQKFRDLKSLLNPDGLIPGQQFFTNYYNEPLAEMQAGKGSLWDDLKTVTELDKVTMNTIRRGIEPTIQSNPITQARIKDLQSHSVSTGSGAYDKTSPMFKSAFFYRVSQAEGSNVRSAACEDVDDEVKAKRQKLAEEDDKMSIEEAKKIKQRKTPKKQLSRSTKILPELKTALQEHLSGLAVFDQNKVFPTEKKFKVQFYRQVDGENDPKLREMEEKVFLGVKNDIEKDCDQTWDNSSFMNKKADIKVASAIRKSFLNYERTRLTDEKTYFKFA